MLLSVYTSLRGSNCPEETLSPSISALMSCCSDVGVPTGSLLHTLPFLEEKYF